MTAYQLIKKAQVPALICLVISCLIFPNSLKLFSAASIVFSALLALCTLRKDNILKIMLQFWFANATITVIYILIGVVNSAPEEAIYQILLIYVLFPMLWIFVSKSILDTVSIYQIYTSLIRVGVLACFSVFYYYYSFLINGPDSVKFFIEEPNVNTITDGFIAGSMYVYGTLIFIFGGYFACFEFTKAKIKNYIILVLFSITALISGRGALILSLFIGAFVNLISVKDSNHSKTKSNYIHGVILLFGAIFLIVLFLNYFNLDLEIIIEPVAKKIVTFGGDGRNPQLFAFIDGIFEQNGFGAGHGISTSYTVSENFPWRYEMIWVASIYRVGFLGAAVYAAPFLLALFFGFKKLLTGNLDKNSKFLFGGFVAAFVATNTNPYIEAFVFQWMFILPVMYLLSKNFKIKFKDTIK
jgi:hypothetical protein